MEFQHSRLEGNFQNYLSNDNEALIEGQGHAVTKALCQSEIARYILFIAISSFLVGSVQRVKETNIFRNPNNFKLNL